MFIPDAISEIYTVETGNHPERVRPLNEFEVAWEFFSEVVTQTAVVLYKIKACCCQFVEVNCTISILGHLRTIIDSKGDSQEISTLMIGTLILHQQVLLLMLFISSRPHVRSQISWSDMSPNRSNAQSP